MVRMTYSNRYRNINYVVDAVGELGEATANTIAPIVNLSRQAVLDILKHAESWGYVSHTEEPYRFYKDGTVFVTRKVWRVTEYGKKNAGWYVDAVRNAIKRGGQLPLL